MGGRKGSGGYSRVTGGRLSRSGGKEFQEQKKESVNEVLGEYDRIQGRREIERDVKRFIQDAGNKQSVTIADEGVVKVTQDAYSAADELAGKIMEKAQFMDHEMDQLYQQLKPKKGVSYYISKEDRSDIPGLDPRDAREYQQRSKIPFTSDMSKTGVDQLYYELYNDGANPYGLSGATSPGEQLHELNGVLTRLQNERYYGITSKRGQYDIGGGSMSVQQIRAEIRDRILENTALAAYVHNTRWRKKK